MLMGGIAVFEMAGYSVPGWNGLCHHYLMCIDLNEKKPH
jgi:hypothetical protein